MVRDVFRIQLYICDGAFLFCKNSYRLSTVNFFRKKLHHSQDPKYISANLYRIYSTVQLIRFKPMFQLTIPWKHHQQSKGIFSGSTETSAKQKGCFQGVQKNQQSRGMLSGSTETAAKQRMLSGGYRNISKPKGSFQGVQKHQQSRGMFSGIT